MNDPEKNKPILRDDTANKSNLLSKEMDKAKANRYPASQTQLGPVSDIKDTTKQKKLDPNHAILKKKFCLGEAKINLEKLTGIDNLSDLLNKYGLLIKKELINSIYSDSIKIDNKPLKISDLEGAYTELFEAVNIETLYTHLLYNKEKAIYVISGTDTHNEDNAKNLLVNKLEQSKREAICNHIGIFTHPYYTLSNNKTIQLVNSAFTEKTFKELCDQHTYKKIYWIQWNESQSIMMLQQIYNPNFYINRNFNKVVINNKSKRIYGLSTTLTQGTEDKFIFSGIVDDAYDALGKLLGVKPSLFKKDKIFVKQDVQKSKNKFDSLSGTVHWLEVEGDENNQQIIWRNSKGSLDGLRNYVDKKEYKKEYEESELLDTIQDRQAVIIAADPGMGKSTTLTRLYQLKFGLNNLSKQGTCNWVINIKLQNHLEAIKNINTNGINILEFLSEVDKNLQDNITQYFLKFTLEAARNYKTALLIIFDGFDKVTDASDRNKVTALLTHLKNNTHVTFWVTTSLEYQKTLEDALSTFAVTLKPLDADAQKDFLKKNLTNRLSLVCSEDALNISEDDTIDNSKIEKYSKAFINKVQSTFQNDQSFIGIPLHLHLLLTSSQEEKNAAAHIVRKDYITSFKNWVRENNEPDFGYIDKNRLQICANIIDRKYETYLKKVGIIEDTQKNKFKSDANKLYKKLAKNLVYSLQSAIEKKDIDIILATGLVQFDQHGLGFIHPVLGEYFLSEYYMDLIIKEGNRPNQNKWEVFLTAILIDVQYKSIRSFINERLGNKQLTETTLQKWGEKIKTLSNSEGNTGKSNKRLEAETPLHIAAKEGNIHIAYFLLNSIQDDVSFLINFIKKLDKDGNTALHIAMRNKHTNCLDALLKKLDNDPEKLKILMEIKNNDGNTALHIAMRNTHTNCLDALLKKFDNETEKLKKLLEIQNKNDNTALHIAIRNTRTTFAKKLLKLFENDPEALKKLLEIQNNDGNTALHTAAEKNHQLINALLKPFKNDPKAIKKLLKIKDSDGYTALHIATITSNLVFINALLEFFALYPEKLKKLIKIQNNSGETVLYIAVYTGNYNIIATLVKPFEQDLEALKKWIRKGNNHGNTVVHMAADTGNYNIIATLVKPFEQDLEALNEIIKTDNKDKKTALHIALQKKHYTFFAKLIQPFDKEPKELTKHLKTMGSHQETALDIALEEEDYNFIISLLKPLEQHKKQLKEVIQTQKEDKKTILHIVAEKGNEQFVTSLLKPFEKDLKALQEIIATEDRYKETALHIALQKGHDDFVISLLQPLKQDKKKLEKITKIKNKDGKTAYEVRKNQNIEIKELFFDKSNKKYRSSIDLDKMISPLTESMSSLLTQDESLYNVPSTTNNTNTSYPIVFHTNERVI
ncbi:ankyrin repeat domain-containing protein [Candidatus Cardinium hertigii]|uniref:ankyrin repeat domain-containing protein n=1 Tax=Candidatus Cardinium hertigii TaxID=247481 RepID=UPI003D7DC5F3